MTSLEIGHVFRWNNFPEPRFGTEKKARWFIYLGESGPFFKPTIAYISTTTTNINEFKKGGSLQSHDYCVFSAKTSPFEEDCILDYDNQPYSPLREKLLNNADIEIKGKFDTNTMKMIYNRLIKSSAISPIILQDIHESFNRAGITGLRKIR